MTTLPQDSDAATLAEALAQRCAQATLHGDTWQACCPSHEDGHPSLSITPAGTRVLVHCHAGCTNAQVVAALGLTLGDLFVAKPVSNGHKRLVKVYAYVDAAGQVSMRPSAMSPKPSASGSQTRRTLGRMSGA